MLLSEICKNKDVKCTFVREGEFDAVGLIGLRKNESEKHIAYLLDIKYLEGAIKDGMDCLIVPAEIVDEVKSSFEGGICTAGNPKESFFLIHNLITENKTFDENDIDETAIIAETAIIPDKGIKIGANTVIEDYVVLKNHVEIGDNCRIMSGCVIGTPAYYYFGEGENADMVNSSGYVKIGNHVIIHSNSTVCRGVIGGPTLIGDNTSLDSNVFFAHDVQVGANCTFAAGCVLGGWAEAGDDCYFGLGVTVAPIVRVNDKAKCSIGAVLTKDVPKGTQYSGNFAIEHGKFIQNLKESMK